MQLEERLRMARNNCGLSQEALAEQINVSRQTISKWERGVVSPSADNLVALSKVLGIPTDALLKDNWTQPEVAEPCIEIIDIPEPDEVKSSRLKQPRLLLLLTTLILAMGIIICVLLFLDFEDTVPSSQLEHEVIDPSKGTVIELFPLD